jgi:hypothetical protein
VSKIFKDTHQIIAKNIHKNIYDIYGIELDEKKLLWGSISPDILPKYKLHRHYKKESLDFVVNEIVKLIFICRLCDFNGVVDPIILKILSYTLGVISHYLSDFVCLPHAERWTFKSNMVKHINYESKLNEYALYYDFKKNVITVGEIDIFGERVVKLKPLIKQFIEDVIDEYSKKTGYKHDLNYALSLSLKVSYFIIDTAKAYNHEAYKHLAFEF